MSFSHPWWLPAGAAGCLLLIGLWHRYDARQATDTRKVRLGALAAATDAVDIGRAAPGAARICSWRPWHCLFVALAGPLVGYRWELITRRGIRHRVRDRHLAQHVHSRCASPIG